MKEKKYLLECRGLNFNEYCELEKVQNDYAKENPDDKSGLGRIGMSYMMQHFYPDAPLDKLTVSEVAAIYARTLELSGAIREAEIKNLKPASAGSTNEQAIAKTAAG